MIEQLQQQRRRRQQLLCQHHGQNGLLRSFVRLLVGQVIAKRYVHVQADIPTIARERRGAFMHVTCENVSLMDTGGLGKLGACAQHLVVEDKYQGQGHVNIQIQVHEATLVKVTAHRHRHVIQIHVQLMENGRSGRSGHNVH